MSDVLPSLQELTSLVENDKSFVLRIVQPGLVGLMDGSVSTLAPIFATAFATHNSHTVFLIRAASAVGAGISMAFSEGLCDDVAVGLIVIALIRHKYFKTSLALSCLKVIVGRGLVFAAGVLIGQS